jgi:hypothetical protein
VASMNITPFSEVVPRSLVGMSVSFYYTTWCNMPEDSHLSRNCNIHEAEIYQVSQMWLILQQVLHVYGL